MSRHASALRALPKPCFVNVPAFFFRNYEEDNEMQVIFYANIQRVILVHKTVHIYTNTQVYTQRAYRGLIDSFTHLPKNLCKKKKSEKVLIQDAETMRIDTSQCEAIIFYVFCFYFYFLFFVYL